MSFIEAGPAGGAEQDNEFLLMGSSPVELIISGVFLLLGFALLKLIHRTTRPDTPGLEPDERPRLVDYAALAIDGVQELTKGNLVVTDRYLHWQPNRVPLMSGNSLRIPLSEISGLGLGKRIWWAAFGQPIVIQTPGHTLRVFLEGRYFEQVFDARRQKRWMESVSQLAGSVVPTEPGTAPLSDAALSLERRFLVRRAAAVATVMFAAFLIVAGTYAATGIPSGFSLFVLLLGALFALVALLIAVRRLFSSSGGSVRLGRSGRSGGL